jgi:hypothetical protein
MYLNVDGSFSPVSFSDGDWCTKKKFILR